MNLIVTVGPGADPTRLGRRPPHVRVTDYVPQELLLPHCRLVVSHGGTGSVTGALANGLPQLILPQGADNFLNATAVTRAGVGLALPPDALTSDAIADAAARLVSEPAFEAAARAVRAELAELPSAEEVLDGLLAA